LAPAPHVVARWGRVGVLRSPVAVAATLLAMLLVPMLVALTVVAPVGADPVSADPLGTGTDPGVETSLATPVLSARRIPGLLQDQAATVALANRLDPLVDDLPPSTCVAVDTVGGIAYRHQGSLPLVPASTMKLVTSAVALEVLGDDHRTPTVVVAERPPVGGVIDGDLWIVGGGDPLLATTGYAASLFGAPDRTVSPFEDLAQALVAAGVTQVTGSIRGDDSRHDAERRVATWPDSYLEGDTVGALGALRVNSGRIGWVATPDEAGAGGGPGDPAVLAAATLTTLLKDADVGVDGRPGRGVAPPSGAIVASVDGPTMVEVLDEVNAWSNNGASELLLKEIALASGGEPTTTAGAAVVAQELAAWGLPSEGIRIVDGSGLDPGNGLTCDLLAGVIDRELTTSGGESLLLASLAVAGERGTLTYRPLPPGPGGRVVAKTGSLNEVRSLAGVAIDRNGDQTVFAVVANGELGDPRLDAALVDAIAAELTRPLALLPLQDLGPLPVRAGGGPAPLAAS